MRAILLTLAVLVTSAPAEAGFSVCNKSNHDAKVALGQFNGRAWESDGWWTVKAQRCTKMIDGPLVARYYYLYATDGRMGTWDGGRGFCVGNSAKFSIVGRTGCSARGFERKGFFQVDTAEKPDFTQSLSD